MNEKKELRTSYVGRANEETQRLLREVVQENEKLQLRIDALQRQLSAVEGESRNFAQQFAEVEERNMNLANLYVSSYQLHGTLDRGAVLASIKEILINLIGCEELAVFELSEDAASLDLVTSFGIDDEQYRRISIRDHVLGKLVSAGGTYIGGAAPSADDSLSRDGLPAAEAGRPRDRRDRSLQPPAAQAGAAGARLRAVRSPRHPRRHRSVLHQPSRACARRSRGVTMSVRPI